MTNLETNIFPITNLAELSSEYKLYQIKGLSKSHDEYYQNCQIIIERLSYRLQNAVTIIERDGMLGPIVKTTELRKYVKVCQPFGSARGAVRRPAAGRVKTSSDPRIPASHRS